MHLNSWKEVQNYNERQMVWLGWYEWLTWDIHQKTYKHKIDVLFSATLFLYYIFFYLYVIGNFNTFFDIMWCVNCETIYVMPTNEKLGYHYHISFFYWEISVLWIWNFYNRICRKLYLKLHVCSNFDRAYRSEKLVPKKSFYFSEHISRIYQTKIS